jgi:hypothetical protein
LADGTVGSLTPRLLGTGDQLQGLVEVVIGELPDKVEATLANRRVYFPHVGVVQLPQLLVVAHLTCLYPGEHAPDMGRLAVSSVRPHRPRCHNETSDVANTVGRSTG